MENLKEDYRESESLLQYAVVRLALDVLQRDRTNYLVGYAATAHTHRDIARLTTNISPHYPIMHHIDDPVRLRCRCVHVVLLLVHTYPWDQCARISPV
jgi:hypothetical protein